MAHWARQYEYVQAIQFSFFAVSVPALLVAGAPWRWLGLASREPHEVSDDGVLVSPTQLRFIDRLTISRGRRHAARRAYVVTTLFCLMAVVWRTVPVVDSLVKHPWLTSLESVLLVGIGALLWVDLIESPPLKPATTRPFRLGMSAVSMWTVWVLAYLGAMSRDSWYPAFVHLAGHGVSFAADQQLSAGLMWFLSASAFLPVVFWNLIHWLSSEENPDEELYRLVRKERTRSESDVKN